MIIAGTLSLFLGVIGAFVPGLPTTPFILLSAGLYVKSSPALYNKVVNHRLTNRYLNATFRTNKTGTRNLAILIMWLMIIFTSFFVINKTLIVILLIVAGIAGTYFKIKFLKEHNKKGERNTNF